MYTTRKYPVDVQVQQRKARERAEWRRHNAEALKRRLWMALPALTRS
jgi:hypothetical protein